MIGASRRNIIKVLGSIPLIDFSSDGTTNISAQEPTAPYIRESENYIHIGNQQLELAFWSDHGGLGKVINKNRDSEIVDTDERGSLWEIEFYTSEYEQLGTHSGLSRGVNFESTAEGDTATLQITHESSEIHSPSGRIGEYSGSVITEVTIEAGDTLSYWDVTVENEGERAIRTIQCPIITDINPLVDDGSDSVYTPTNLGREIPNPTEAERLPEVRYPSAFGTMQFTTYLAEDTGLYVSCLDSEGYMKTLRFSRTSLDDNTLEFATRHLQPYQPGTDVNVPYQVAFGLHEGSWRDACDRYREWVETEGWLQNNDPQIPNRLQNRGLSYSMRSYHREEHESPQVNADFEETREMVSTLQEWIGTPIGFFWGGWQRHGEPGNGDYWPPYEGEEPFEETVRGLRQQEVGTFCFLNPTKVIETSDYWQSHENPERIAIQNREGELKRYGGGDNFTRYEVEPVLGEWREHYEQAIQNKVKNGIGHIELDGVPMQWRSCWNGDHDHPMGIGGNWYQQRVRELLQSLHDDLDTDEGLILSGEGIADFYLPYINHYLTRDGHAYRRHEEYEIVPMFPYTFNDYAMGRNSEGTVGPSANTDVQRELAGRSVAWNTSPWLEGDYRDTSVDGELLEYNSRLAQTRVTFGKRFFNGQMLQKPQLETDQITISSYQGEFTSEEILCSAWQSDWDETGIILTSVSDQSNEVDLSLSLPEQPYSLADADLVYFVNDGEYEIIESNSDMDLEVNVTLSPTDVCLIVVTKKAEDQVESLESIITAQNDPQANAKLVADAKRAFEEHEFQKSIELAKEAISADDPGTVTTNEDDDGPSESEGDDGPSESGENGESEEEIPGFGFGSALGAIGGGGYLLSRYLTDENEES